MAEEDLPIYDRVQLPHLIDTSRIWDDLVRHDARTDGGSRCHPPRRPSHRMSTANCNAYPHQRRTNFYDRLIIATGSRPLTRLLLGKEPRGVHALRTREHAEAIIDACQPGPGGILGGGLLGLEVADALNRRGC